LLVNVQRLENYKSKLILFPRREGKFKKGEIADSTADKLKSAEAEKQNISKHVVNKPVRKLKEKAQKIGKEQKDLKTYRKLRQLRVNKYYKGTREKRAKEQAEKEEKK
jgi:large subunit ribosomal protein L13e